MHLKSYFLKFVKGLDRHPRVQRTVVRTFSLNFIEIHFIDAYMLLDGKFFMWKSSEIHHLTRTPSLWMYMYTYIYKYHEYPYVISYVTLYQGSTDQNRPSDPWPTSLSPYYGLRMQKWWVHICLIITTHFINTKIFHVRDCATYRWIIF